jgi:hypothetical protein
LRQVSSEKEGKRGREPGREPFYCKKAPDPFFFRSANAPVKVGMPTHGPWPCKKPMTARLSSTLQCRCGRPKGLAPRPPVTLHQLLLEGVLLLGHRAGDDERLTAFQAGPGQVEHLRRLHIGQSPEHLLEFRQIGETGEPTPRTEALSDWGLCGVARYVA